VVRSGAGFPAFFADKVCGMGIAPFRDTPAFRRRSLR
jgi:hypothetical protein